MKDLLILAGLAVAVVAVFKVKESQAEESARKANVFQDNINAVTRFESFGGGF